MKYKREFETNTEEAPRVVFRPGTIQNPRTMWDTQGYNDNEKVVGESMTDPSAYVPTKELIARITRGEKVPAGKYGRYDITAKDKKPLSEETANQIIDSLEDPTEDPNFDISDVPALKERQAQIEKRVKMLKAEKKKKIIEQKKAETEQKKAKELADAGIRSSNPESESPESESSNQNRSMAKK